MGDEGMPFHLCDECNGIVGLWEEVVGKHPVTGKDLFMHDGCAQPEHQAIPIKDWLDQRVAAKEKAADA